MENLTNKHNSTKIKRKRTFNINHFLLLLFEEHDRAQKCLKCNINAYVAFFLSGVNVRKIMQ